MRREKRAKISLMSDLHSVTEFSNDFFSVMRDQDVRVGLDYSYVSTRGHGVRIMAFDAEGRLALVMQYRHPAGRKLWEIPAGGIELGESAIAAGRRELLEEANLTAVEWLELSTVLPLPNLSDFEGVFVAAFGVVQSNVDRPNTAEYNETIESRFVGMDELGSMVKNGEISDEKTIAAFAISSIFDLPGNSESL